MPAPRRLEAINQIRNNPFQLSLNFLQTFFFGLRIHNKQS
jgi:hypothetical protein